MGLFTKKDPCAICGGKVKALIPWKVDGQLVCNDCYGRVDLPLDTVNSMTMDEFRSYLAFRDENAQLKQQFQITQKVDFGVFEDKLVFDTGNSLFCMNADLKSTVFEGKDIKTFVIREDGTPLFEGSAAGLVCYNSAVPDRLALMSPMLQQMAMMKRMQREEERRARQEGNDSYIPRYYEDIAEPFEKYIVEIYCNHPYWNILTVEKKGPTFNNEYPSASDYLREYQEGAEIMRQLAHALMAVAFPGATEQRVGAVTAAANGQSAAAPASSVDVVEEIRRFKELMEQGILTEDEFAAKKRKLLGI